LSIKPCQTQESHASPATRIKRKSNIIEIVQRTVESCAMENGCDGPGARCNALQQLILARLRLDIEDPLGLTYILNSCDHLLDYLRSERQPQNKLLPPNQGTIPEDGDDLDNLPQGRSKRGSVQSCEADSIWSLKTGSKSWSASEVLTLRLHYDKQAEVQAGNNLHDLISCNIADIGDAAQELRITAIIRETALTLQAIKTEALRIVDRQLIRVRTLNYDL
jgi:hypothetical protein